MTRHCNADAINSGALSAYVAFNHLFIPIYSVTVIADTRRAGVYEDKQVLTLWRILKAAPVAYCGINHLSIPSLFRLIE